MKVPPYKLADSLMNDDNHIITIEDHFNQYPNNNVQNEKSFHFVGKSIGAMKQMEKNRTSVNFFESDDLDKDLQKKYAHIRELRAQIFPMHNLTECLNTWLQNPTGMLNLLGMEYFTNSQINNISSLHDFMESLPQNVHALAIYQNPNFPHIPQSFADRKSLVTLFTNIDNLPVMPHVQVCEWSPKSKIATCDFSKWTSLRILKINAQFEPKICLPVNLISFSLHVYNYSPRNKRKFEDVFKDDDDRNDDNISRHITIFQSLKHLYLYRVAWTNLPSLLKCRDLTLSSCYNIQSIDVPMCRSIEIITCISFSGFDQNTLNNNDILDTVKFYHNFNVNKWYQLPVGSSSGYRHIYIWDTHIASLPNKYVPYAFVSLSNSGPCMYIYSQQIRDVMKFYQYHGIAKISHDLKDTSDKNLTKDELVEKSYNFNWSKFATKIQRQHRFKKFIRHTYPIISKYISRDNCMYDIAKIMGSYQTFGLCNNNNKRTTQS